MSFWLQRNDESDGSYEGSIYFPVKGMAIAGSTFYRLALSTDVLNCGNHLGTRGKGLENPRDTGLDINEPQNNHP